jgi:hypothetical protein
MQCKGCIHQAVCKHIFWLDKLEGELPVTAYPFKSTVTCCLYVQEQPQARNDLRSQLSSKEISTMQG